MSDIALAPLPWQDEEWRSLSERIAHEKLPHALLMHGAAGTGKGHLARLLALSLLCEQPRQFLPCGHCHACALFAAGSHPDFFLASASYGINDNPDEEDGKSRKAKKTAAPSKQIKIDCIRDLIHFSTHSAHQSGRRVALIEPAEWLNHNAANALLKTLEEPGEGMFIILVSHQPSRLLPTLRSRCQSLFCATPEHTQASAWLCQHIAADRAATALACSGGAPLKALAAVHAEYDLVWREVVLLLQSCRTCEVTYLFAAESLAKHDAVMVLEWWLDIVHQQCRAVPEKALLLFSDQLLAARRKMIGTTNPNARMVFETLLIDWMALQEFFA